LASNKQRQMYFSEMELSWFQNKSNLNAFRDT
jgi:hypothetical protein